MPEHFQKHELPGCVQIIAPAADAGGLAKIVVTSKSSTAEIYPHGAHITHFQKNGEPPLLFLSRKSLFQPDKAIRGGVPICFPWFGAREGVVMHGVARLSEWELSETAAAPDGSVKVVFSLPANVLVQAGWPAAKVNFIVTVAETLTMELLVANSTAQEFVFEACLHAYFSVGDIAQVSIHGLKGLSYQDKVDHFTLKQETADAVKISSEVDRVYLKATGTVKIHDGKPRRIISVEKSGSASTVVWNPWIEKAKAMSDFVPDEYKEMVCVEAGNVGESKVSLAAGKSASLKVVLGSAPLP
jgi:glucose-6-phosphate 1-epimerase